MYRILIVEDDDVIADVVSEELQKWGYETLRAVDYQHILACFRSFSPQLVLLDISLPYFNGYHWCGEIRKESSVPILVLSSASDNLNMVMAMNMGADDFIAKPFSLSVLVAKVQATFRRAYEFEKAADFLEYRGALLHLGDGTLTVDGVRTELTKNEYRILRLLLLRRGKTVSREEIMRELWESDSYIDDNTLTVNINRLRKTLEEAGLPGAIHTKKGVGYLVE